MLSGRAIKRVVIVSVCLLVGVACGQDTSNDADVIVGTWRGELVFGETVHPILFHVARDGDGTLSAKMDSPEQGAIGMPADEVSFIDGQVSIVVRSAQGLYEGTLKADGDHIEGTWSQPEFDFVAQLVLERTTPQVWAR